MLVESADANSASKLFLALTNNDFNSKFVLYHPHYGRNCQISSKNYGDKNQQIYSKHAIIARSWLETDDFEAQKSFL